MKDEKRKRGRHPHLSSFRLHRLSSSFIRDPFSTMFDPLQQRIDASGLLFNGVPYEVKHRSMPQIQREAQLLAHVWRGMI